MGKLMEVPSPSPVPASCSAPVWGKDPAWKEEQSLLHALHTSWWQPHVHKHGIGIPGVC
jgi:hypothetical protein